MQIGVIGLGRMGGNISRRLMKAGHHCVVFDVEAKLRGALVKDGARDAESLDDLVKVLEDGPRAIWLIGFGGHIEGGEPMDTEPKPNASQDPVTAQHASR